MITSYPYVYGMENKKKTEWFKSLDIVVAG